MRESITDPLALFADGIGAAAATSGVLTQIQGRIWGYLYLQPAPLSLDDIAAGLDLSKSNVSVQIRGLLEWHLVHRVAIPGSRKDHYEAATNLLRVMREIMERRFRWNLRQVLHTVEETQRAAESQSPAKERAELLAGRLGTLRLFFSVLENSVGAFTRGQQADVAELAKLFIVAEPRLLARPEGRKR